MRTCKAWQFALVALLVVLLAASVAATSFYELLPQQNYLKVIYAFNETNKILKNYKNTSLYNLSYAATWQGLQHNESVDNGAIAFNGSVTPNYLGQNHIQSYELPNFNIVNNNYSMLILFKFNTTTKYDGNGQRLLSGHNAANYDRISVDWNTNVANRLTVYQNSDNCVATVPSSIPIYNQTWYELIITRNGTQYSLYLNRTLVNTTLCPNAATALTWMTIGGNDGTRTLNGSISEIYIWNISLSHQEIEQMPSFFNISYNMIATNSTFIAENTTAFYNLNISSPSSIYTISARLYYNNTLISPQFNSYYDSGNDRFVFYENFSTNFLNYAFSTLPLNTYWIINYSLPYVGTIQLFQYNLSQSLLNGKYVDRCSNDTFSTPVLNISYLDELTAAPIAVSNTHSLTFYDGHNSQLIERTLFGNVRDAYCTNVFPSLMTYNWDMTGNLILSATGYATRIFTQPSSVPLLISNNPATRTNYSLITLGNSTTVTYTWMSTSYNLLSGTMRIYRCSSNYSKTLVESVTVDSGIGYANIELTNTPYSYDFIYNGLIYSQTGFSDCHIEYAATRTYYVNLFSSNATNLGLLLVPCTLTQPSGTTVNLAWGANTYDTSQLQACILGYNPTLYGLSQPTFTSCSNSTSYSLTASLSNSTTLVRAKLTQSGNNFICDNLQLNLSSEQPPQGSLGIEGLFGFILLILGVVLLLAGETSGMTQVFGFILVMGACIYIGFAAFSWVVGFSAAAFLLIIVFIARNTRSNK